MALHGLALKLTGRELFLFEEDKYDNNNSIR